MGPFSKGSWAHKSENMLPLPTWISSALVRFEFQASLWFLGLYPRLWWRGLALPFPRASCLRAPTLSTCLILQLMSQVRGFPGVRDLAKRGKGWVSWAAAEKWAGGCMLGNENLEILILNLKMCFSGWKCVSLLLPPAFPEQCHPCSWCEWPFHSPNAALPHSVVTFNVLSLHLESMIPQNRTAFNHQWISSPSTFKSFQGYLHLLTKSNNGKDYITMVPPYVRTFM